MAGLISRKQTYQALYLQKDPSHTLLKDYLRDIVGCEVMLILWKTRLTFLNESSLEIHQNKPLTEADTIISYDS